ncbi:gamma-glutamyltransferase [Saxibacter everestensis]|uniref:Gamma-glutamyltransferase n=1 Tax=Saxibacter everestensis TaxID=2909229 RepID=A0ABY8QXT4_9MICO|nr:gamma-glutamyltransferase [Brevibacteriaceae bacterium ZFBP1038]
MTSFTTRPTLRGTFGMAASTHWLASATASSVLERGGNAYDAAVAAGFVLHVVEPHLNGPGGDLTAIIKAAHQQSPRVLMGQGPAPAGASIEHFHAEGLHLIPGAGALAAAVPGAVDAWLLLSRDYGSWELDELWQYAIDYARNGHPVLGQVATTIRTVSDLFAEHWPGSSEQWMPGGRLPVEGELIRNPAWADTMERLLAEGRSRAGADGDREARIEGVRSAWAEGFVAREIEDFVREPHRHSSGTDHAGVLNRDDLRGFRADWEEPATIDFRGHTIVKVSGWSQGPALLQALKILDGFDDDDIDPSTASGAHIVLETLKLCLADREAYYGEDMPVSLLRTLLSDAYAAGRRAQIGAQASAEFRPGAIDGHPAYRPQLRTGAQLRIGALAQAVSGAAGEPTVRPNGEVRGDTCHLDIVDSQGNMISATPSGGWLQSSPYIPSLGFCLGTRLQMNWLDPESPSALVPGRRPRSTLTPTLVIREGEAVLALGSPGGDQQDQWQLLFLLRMLVGGYGQQEAIDAPAFHTTSMPGSFWPRTWEPGGAVVEDRLGDDVIASLEARGHRVTRAGDWALGRLSSVGRDPETGVLTAAANPRGMQGYAVGR